MSTNVFDPPALEKGTLRVIPLGGLGEIGRNMTVFEFDGKLLIVDCGVLFPEEHQPGVDLILPDFEPIRDRLDDVVGVDQQGGVGAEGRQLGAEGVLLGVVQQREAVGRGAGRRDAEGAPGLQVRRRREASDVGGTGRDGRRPLVGAARPHLDAGAVAGHRGHP